MGKILFSIAVGIIIYCFCRLIHINVVLFKMHKAMSELHTMPIDEWEEKWGEFVQREYHKCNDPHRAELEADMDFWRRELEELKKGDKNDKHND